MYYESNNPTSIDHIDFFNWQPLEGKTKIGVELSGGTGSTLVYWMLCKHANTRPELKIVPIIYISSVVKNKKIVSICENITKYMKKNFPNANIMETQTTEFEFHCSLAHTYGFEDNKIQSPFLNEGLINSHMYYRKKLISDLADKNIIEVCLRGMSCNPKMKITDNLNISHLRVKSKDFKPNRNYVVYTTNKTPLAIYDPLAQFTKQFVADLYSQLDLNDDLLPLTKSCVTPDINGNPCKKCFWCNIRKYYFKKLDF